MFTLVSEENKEKHTAIPILHQNKLIKASLKELTKDSWFIVAWESIG